MIRSPYGTWRSPITAAALARSAIALDYIQVERGVPSWVESRPAEGGRRVIVTPAADGSVIERTPAAFNARTRVHEYGGRPYCLAGDRIYCTHFADQKLYACEVANAGVADAGAPARAPVPLTPEGYRYADFHFDAGRNALLCVREDHTGSGEARNTLAVIDVSYIAGALQPGRESAGRVLFGGSDFVASPRVSPDGRRIAWVAWNHPDMPWDASTLYVAERTADGGITGVRPVAGAAGESRQSVLEPRWDVDGTLYFVSDRSGWWNLYRLAGSRVEPVYTVEADIAGPLWTLGQSSYALTGDGRAVVRSTHAASDRLSVVTLASGASRPLELPFASFSSVELLSAGTAVAVAASAVAEPAIITVDLEAGAHRILRAPVSLELDPRYISIAEPLEYPTAGTLTAHAFFYPPANPEFEAPSGEKPPVIVKAHGGPTSHSCPTLSLATQYWTSRGFAVLDVNYGGSSGFGRAYRERLEGEWGVVDVHDVVAGVEYLARAGRIDAARAAIRGGSAGGFTVLAALAFHDVFKAGANYYGVSDLEALARDTHKFESRYLDRLIAPLPGGQALYEARSPIRHLEGFSAPLITFQGSEDRVVPPSQSRAIVAALERKGIAALYFEFEGEQHGFRKAESLVRSLEAELAFYGRIFGFAPTA